ncbi:LPS assembly protein LptD [Croceicoccus sp. F390]|uniref:LPS-assembly protein LptD n=1 Tax=Croceicoccus esteveae TaxID=3075597 RepID=A0ABU2ZDZ2_9SPHN|nr:LPS assembly protein LptD [Croceicoccus sp. F390]MDT0574825.1 LPS assembly protein LptD [Croceicoccus sp. F390]
MPPRLILPPSACLLSILPVARAACPPRHPARRFLMVASRTMAACAWPLLALLPGQVAAQATGPDAPLFWDDGDPDNAPEGVESRPDGAGEVPDPFQLDEPPSGTIGFAADEVEYDTGAQAVAATGNVLLRREAQEVRADRVSWNRTSGEIVASGNVRLVDDAGNILYTDRITLTEELRAGALENLLLVLSQGGRLAAMGAARDDDGQIRLEDGAYSACAIETAAGCPKTPTWRVTAHEVLYNPDTQKVRFSGARLELFGKIAVPLPGLAIFADGRAVSGLTSPDIRVSQANGVELSAEYYWRIAQNRELTLGASVFTDVLPMVTARYRSLTAQGAYQITGYATSSKRIPIGSSTVQTEQEAFRGYLDTNGQYNLSPTLSIIGSLRLASDRTFLRRYDISRDDRLRSMLSIRHIDDDTFFSFTGWGFQTLRTGEDQGLVPFALPLVEYRRRIDDPLLGGRIMLEANTLLLARSEGQDTQRALAGATWSRRTLTSWGQEITTTAMVRGDLYHSDENVLTGIDQYRGEPGWQTRGVAIGAVDVKWPLTGSFLGGTQVLTPRVQFVASPQIRNLVIPNEDSRSVDLEDSNLFALNRFAGHDRVEDGVRFTYGLDWRWQAPGWRVDANIGQSYRVTDDNTLLPDGTGLTDRTSDVVGRAEIRWEDFVSFTHRFRIDKDELAFRRNEFDIAVGTRETYAEASYLKLDRDVPLVLEDLNDREELRLAGRYAFARFWSVFGSTVINLTDASEDPSQMSDGFEPLRTRVGVAYEDDCLEFAVTWRNDNFDAGDIVGGNTVLFSFGLKNLGWR